MPPVSVRAWEEAVRVSGLEPPARVRPNPLLWLKYVVWGPLPERHRGWVPFDTTCRTWAARHFGRLVVLVKARIREARALYGQRFANAIRRERAADRQTRRSA